MAEEVGNSLNPSWNPTVIKPILAAPQFYRLGAVGPDMLFFADDYGDAIQTIAHAILQFYDEAVGPIVGLYEKYIEPVVDVIDSIEAGIDAAMDEVTCNLFSTVADELDALSARFSKLGPTLVEDLFAKTINAFDLMKPPIQDGSDEHQWFWFDMLHYRKTGAFVTRMWQLAATDNQRAYVLGYATHIAADVTGHPYVNAAVGGPYRSHNQRHHFVENVLDVWMYDTVRGENMIQSNLHLKLPHGSDLDSLGSLLGVLEGSTDVPADLAEVFGMVYQAMTDTFDLSKSDLVPNKLSARFLSVEELNQAHFVLLAALKAMTSGYIPPPGVPGKEELDAIIDAAKQFGKDVTHPPKPPDAPPGLCVDFWNDDCDFSLDALSKWAQFVWDMICYVGKLLVWLAKVIRDLVKLFVCTVTAPAKTAIRASLWLVQYALHTLLEELRQTLVMAALVPPDRSWVQVNPIAQKIVNLSRSDTNGRYPCRAQESNDGFLAYPKTPVEKPATIPGPYSIGSPFTVAFVGAGDPGVAKDYATSLTPQDTRTVEFDHVKTSLGSMVEVATSLMQGLTAGSILPDWNLDSDRGYGYQNWKATYGFLAWDSTHDIDDIWAFKA